MPPVARILIVEDEEANREVALTICRVAGHVCAAANDGQEALERLASEDYDILLVDVLMPRLDGLELVRMLRATPRWATTPIIGVSARASGSDHAEMLEAGMTAVVTKPYRRGTLLDAIDQVLSPDR